MTNTLVNATNLTKNAESDYSTQSNMPVQESQLMSIDMANAAFIMESLTNLYSDPYLSVIREYVANAIDSHIEAGNPDPVEVTTPGDWSPNLVIKDCGIGMSQDDVFRYGTYGSSDKRDNLKLVGNFGMGSKSALAISNSFTVTAIKDGEYTMASIGRNDEGFGQVDIIVNEPTTEPNGVTITIPITSRNIWNVRDKTKQVISKLPAGMVSVDGVINTDFRENLIKISDDVHVADMDINDDSFYYNKLYVISGGFGYRVADDVVNEIARSLDFDLIACPSAVYIDVPTGSVDLTPSREQLRMTVRTKALIVQATTDALRECTRIYQEKLDAVKTFDDAYMLITEVGAKFDAEDVLKHCTNLFIPGVDNVVTEMVRTGSGEISSRNASRINMFLAETIAMSPENRVIVVEKDKDYSGKSITNRVKSYLTKVTDDTYNQRTPVIILNPNYVDDPKDTKDSLYRYISRTAVYMKLSEIYSAVNEYNKANRSYSSGGSAATGRDDNAIIDSEAISGTDYTSGAYYPTAGAMKKFYEDHFTNGLPVEYVLNNTISSGQNISLRDLQLVMAVRSMKDTKGTTTNMVLIKGGNRKPEYFLRRGIKVATVSEFYAANKDDLLSEHALDAFRSIADYSNNDELGWREIREIDRFRVHHPGCSGTLDIIKQELSATVSPETQAIGESIGAYYRLESTLITLGHRLQAQEKMSTFIDDLNSGERTQNRGPMVVSNLEAIRDLIKHGHAQVGYDMLETLAELLTKEED